MLRLKLLARLCLWSTCNLCGDEEHPAVTPSTTFRVRLTPSIDVAISRVCAAREALVSWTLAAFNLIRKRRRVWLGSHGFFLGSQLPTLLSCRERVLSSTAGEDAQPISSPRPRTGAGDSQWAGRPQAETPKTVPSIICRASSFQTVMLSEETRFGIFFFFYAYGYFLCNPSAKTQCRLSLQNWVHTTVIPEVSVSVIFKRLRIVPSLFQVPHAEFQYPDYAQHVTGRR